MPQTKEMLMKRFVIKVKDNGYKVRLGAHAYRHADTFRTKKEKQASRQALNRLAREWY